MENCIYSDEQQVISRKKERKKTSTKTDLPQLH